MKGRKKEKGIRTQKLEEFKNEVEVFRYTYNLKEPKCMSDQVYLYIRYIIYKLHNTTFKVWKEWSQEYDLIQFEPGYFKEAEVWAMAALETLRGTDFIGSRPPRSVAAALVYIGSIWAGCYQVTQKIVAEASGSSDNAIRKNYVLIRSIVGVPCRPSGSI